MLSKADSRKKAGGISGNGKFLSDLETLSKAYYVDKTRTRLTSSTASSRSKTVGKSQLPGPKMKPEDAKNKPKDASEKDKKSSIWSWKGLKALTHVRSHRFNCCFSLLIYKIEGLPEMFENVHLVVHWKRRDGEQTTSPIRVSQGVAEFKEQLIHTCSVYGSRNGPHHSAKYEAKHFLLFVSVWDAPEIDLGRHRVDLTRLLPLTLEELEEEKSSGKWMTSFRLSGKAKGATINVSFGYDIVENDSTEMPAYRNEPEIVRLQTNSAKMARVVGPSDQVDKLEIHTGRSLPEMSSSSNQSAEDFKDLHEVLPTSRSELSDSVNILYQKFDEEISSASTKDRSEDDILSSQVEPQKVDLCTPPDAGENICGTECEMSCFSVIDKGIEELTAKERVKLGDESLNVVKISRDGLEANAVVELAPDEDASVNLSASEVVPQKDDQSKDTLNHVEKECDMDSKELLMQELEAALNCTSELVGDSFDSREDDESDSLNLRNSFEVNAAHIDHREGKSVSLDDVTNSVASDFLKMLGMEHSPFGLSSESEPESPRELLLRQFEKDVLANGGLLNFDIDDDPAEAVGDIPTGSAWETISEELDHSSMFEGFVETAAAETDAFRTKTRGLKIEDLETEALMQEWGFNEKAFQHSPPSGSSGGFSNPIGIPPDDIQQLPSLADGLGPFVQTKDGGFIRSMNPTLFKNAKSGGSLIMQTSNPVVVPAEMGSGVMDIFQGLASVGIEKLSMQANRLMPLEDIAGKTIQQIAWADATSLEGSERPDFFHQESEIKQSMPGVSRVSRSNKIHHSDTHSSDTEYVSLEDLAPLAMDKIEALSMEGLRIQSGMSDGEAPSNITAQSIGEFSALKGMTVHAGGGGSIGLDGTGGLQLLDIKDNGEDVDGLMSLSLTLDEWVKLDSGEIDDDDLISERTSKILAAHHATSLDQFRGRSKGEKRRGRSRKYGLLGNNFTVALMVQLRDPLRNYEPVGTPMLALIQVERVFVPPKPKLYPTVSLVSESNENDEAPKSQKTEGVIEKVKDDKICDEEPIPQYKVTEVHVAGLKTDEGKKKLWGSTTQQQSGTRWLLANGMGKKNKHTLGQPKDSLWSVSSRVQGKGSKLKELGGRGLHNRNPNLILNK